jgi:mycothiol synthase
MPEDSTALANIQNSAFGGSWGFSPNTPDEISYRVGMRITGPDSIIFLCNGDKVTGYNWTLLLNKHSTLVGVISMIGIDPDFRNQRLGRPLLHAGLEHLVSLGVEYVELEVDQSNAAAIRLYRSVGFREIQQRQWYEVSISDGIPPVD